MEQKIGKRINEYRIMKGDRVADLADMLHMSEGNLRKLLRDEISWTEERIDFFSKRYGIDFKILGRTDNLIEKIEYIDFDEHFDQTMCYIEQLTMKEQIIYMQKFIEQVSNFFDGL